MQPLFANPEQRRAAWSLAIILLLTFACYAGALRFEFVYDDFSLILNNPTLESWRNIPHYFVEHLWVHDHPVGNYYRPVLKIWMYVNYALFGPLSAWWHGSTLLMHLGVTALVYLLAVRICRDRTTALIAAAVFGVHPVHVESVAWIMGVTESLVALLTLGAFLCYLNWREQRAHPRRWFAASLFLAALAFLAKETSLVLAGLIFAYEWFFGSASAVPQEPNNSFVERFRAALRVAVPYFLLTAVYLVARVFVLGRLTRTTTLLPLSTLLLTLPSVVWGYLRLLVWPFGLSAFYDTPYVTAMSLRGFVLPLAYLAVAALVLVRFARRSRVAAFMTVWLVLPMIPILNLTVFPAGEIVHDRFLYLQSVGFSILVALALQRIPSGGWRWREQPAVPVMTATALVAVLAVATFVQKEQWRNNFELYSHGMRVAPNNSRVANNFALLLLYRHRYDEAAQLLEQVIARDPGFYLAHYNLGQLHFLQDNFAAAEREFRRAVELRPAVADSHFQLGRALLRLGRYDDAAAALTRALELQPRGPGYHFALAETLEAQGKLREAIAEFQAELRLDPENGVARFRIQRIENRLKGEPRGDARH